MGHRSLGLNIKGPDMNESNYSAQVQGESSCWLMAYAHPGGKQGTDDAPSPINSVFREAPPLPRDRQETSK